MHGLTRTMHSKSDTQKFSLTMIGSHPIGDGNDCLKKALVGGMQRILIIEDAFESYFQLRQPNAWRLFAKYA